MKKKSDLWPMSYQYHGWLMALCGGLSKAGLRPILLTRGWKQVVISHGRPMFKCLTNAGFRLTWYSRGRKKCFISHVMSICHTVLSSAVKRHVTVAFPAFYT